MMHLGWTKKTHEKKPSRASSADTMRMRNISFDFYKSFSAIDFVVNIVRIAVTIFAILYSMHSDWIDSVISFFFASHPISSTFSLLQKCTELFFISSYATTHTEIYFSRFQIARICFYGHHFSSSSSSRIAFTLFFSLLFCLFFLSVCILHILTNT